MRFLRKILITISIFSFVASTLYITSEAGSLAYGAATVGATSLNIRNGPDTNSSVVMTVSHNEKIVILEKTNDDWYHVAYNGAFGYVASTYLTNVLTAENFTASGKLIGDDVYMRSAPSTSASSMITIDAGTTVNIIGINNGWYKATYGGKTGYIRSDFVTIISGNKSTPAASVAGSKSSSPSDNTSQVSKEQLTQRQQLVDYAMQFVGDSYVYGGASPSTGFDCSGLVHYVFNHFNYDLTRSASSQYAHDGNSISKSDLLPGDLVFFSSNGGYSVTHVGIYIGNNQFVHASCPKIGVVVSDLGSNYYTNVWYGAKRVI